MLEDPAASFSTMWSKNFELLTRNTWRKDRKHRHMFGHWNSIGKILSATSRRKNNIVSLCTHTFRHRISHILIYVVLCWLLLECKGRHLEAQVSEETQAHSSFLAATCVAGPGFQSWMDPGGVGEMISFIRRFYQ